MSELPNGWIPTHAIEIATPIRGVTYKKEQSCDIPSLGYTAVLRANNIQKDKINLTDLVYVPNECISNEQQLLENDIVIAMSSGSASVVGKTAQIAEEINASFGAFCGTLRPSHFIEPRYLGHFLKSDAYRSRISELSRGVNINNLKWSHFEEIEIPLAPLPEQKRIADKLDTLLARIDACRDRLDCIPKIIKQFRQSVLAAATSGRLTEDWRAAQADRVAQMQPQEESGMVARDAAHCLYEVSHTPDFAALHPGYTCATTLANLIHASHQAVGGHKTGNAAAPTEDVHDLSPEMFPQSWALITLRDVVQPNRPITYGILKPGPEIDDGVSYIRVADFPGNKLNLATIRKTSKSMDEEFKRSRLRPGDLIISIRGTVGRIIFIPTELNGANITQDSARLSIQPFVNSRFVYWYLQSPMAQDRMKGSTKGVAVRGINIGDVRALQLPLPSRSEQDEIVRRVENLFDLADRLEARVATVRARVGSLTPATLAKAFRGELVPQDPNDEPASVLLARICAERAGKPPARRTGRGPAQSV